MTVTNNEQPIGIRDCVEFSAIVRDYFSRITKENTNEKPWTHDELQQALASAILLAFYDIGAAYESGVRLTPLRFKGHNADGV